MYFMLLNYNNYSGYTSPPAFVCFYRFVRFKYYLLKSLYKCFYKCKKLSTVCQQISYFPESLYSSAFPGSCKTVIQYFSDQNKNVFFCSFNTVLIFQQEKFFCLFSSIYYYKQQPFL